MPARSATHCSWQTRQGRDLLWSERVAAAANWRHPPVLGSVPDPLQREHWDICSAPEHSERPGPSAAAFSRRSVGPAAQAAEAATAFLAPQTAPVAVPAPQAAPAARVAALAPSVATAVRPA